MIHVTNYGSSDEEELENCKEAPAFEEKPTTGAKINNIERLVKYIPMRLTEEERMMLKVLENALEVCGKCASICLFVFMFQCL